MWTHAQKGSQTQKCQVVGIQGGHRPSHQALVTQALAELVRIHQSLVLFYMFVCIGFFLTKKQPPKKQPLRLDMFYASNKNMKTMWKRNL